MKDALLMKSDVETANEDNLRKEVRDDGVRNLYGNSKETKSFQVSILSFINQLLLLLLLNISSTESIKLR